MSLLYLIPSPIADEGEKFISDYVKSEIANIRYFIVENLRTARRVLRKYEFQADFDREVQFFEWDKHAVIQDLSFIKIWMEEKKHIGLLSEAGLPCIADPGAEAVRLAHQFDYKIIPLASESSIILALISSGFNGQNFTFHGYLPIDSHERIRKIKTMESNVFADNQTQLFMETPYRNNALIDLLLKQCSDKLSLSIATDINGENHWIQSKTISEWKKTPPINIHKLPAVFCLGR